MRIKVIKTHIHNSIKIFLKRKRFRYFFSSIFMIPIFLLFIFLKKGE